MRKHNKKLEAAKNNPGGPPSHNGGAGEKRERCARRTQSSPGWSCGHETRDTNRPGKDIDESDAQVQEAEAALARARVESAAKRRKTYGSECNASTRAQSELVIWVTLAALLLVVSLMWGDAHPSQLSNGNDEPKFRIFSVNISTGSPQAEWFLRSAEVGCFQTVALVEYQLGGNSINKINKLWKQSGFRGTAATAQQSETSTTGTSGGTGIATRNHVTPAAWSMEKSDEGVRSGFDRSAQLARLRGSTVLFVMVLHNKWAGRVRRKLSQNVAARQPHDGQ